MSSASVRVVVRCMPSAEEKAWRVGERTLSPAAGNAVLEFDRVFNDTVNHETFFEQAVGPELAGVLEGHNVIILVYGPPCSGKTHTVFGTSGQTRVKPEARGVILRCGQLLFDHLQRSENSGLACRMNVSFCHVFENGRVADLFDSKKRSLNVVEKAASGMWYDVEGLTEQVVTSPQDVLRLVEKGYLMRNANGCVSDTGAGPTGHGKLSLRGTAPLQQYRPHNTHALFKFTAETVKSASPDEANVGSLIVADLAGLGIEKLLSGVPCPDSGIDAMHQVLRSLAANRVGEVSTLSAKSCLTKLLRPCFGGNSRALVIGTVSLGESVAPLTLKCLQTLKEMQGIKNHHTCVITKGSLSALSSCLEEIRRLKTQLLQKLGIASGADADPCNITIEGSCVAVNGRIREDLSASCQDIAKQVAALEFGITKGGASYKSSDKSAKGPMTTQGPITMTTQGPLPMMRPGPMATQGPIPMTTQGPLTMTTQGPLPMMRPGGLPPQNLHLPNKVEPAVTPVKELPSSSEPAGLRPLISPVKPPPLPVHTLPKGPVNQSAGAVPGPGQEKGDSTSSSDDSDSDSTGSDVVKPKPRPLSGVPPPPLIGIPHIAPNTAVQGSPMSGSLVKPAIGLGNHTRPLSPVGPPAILKPSPLPQSVFPKISGRSEQPGLPAAGVAGPRRAPIDPKPAMSLKKPVIHSSISSGPAVAIKPTSANPSEVTAQPPATMPIKGSKPVGVQEEPGSAVTSDLKVGTGQFISPPNDLAPPLGPTTKSAVSQESSGPGKEVAPSTDVPMVRSTSGQLKPHMIQDGLKSPSDQSILQKPDHSRSKEHINPSVEEDRRARGQTNSTTFVIEPPAVDSLGKLPPPAVESQGKPSDQIEPTTSDGGKSSKEGCTDQARGTTDLPPLDQGKLPPDEDKMPKYTAVKPPGIEIKSSNPPDQSNINRVNSTTKLTVSNQTKTQGDSSITVDTTNKVTLTADHLAPSADHTAPSADHTAPSPDHIAPSADHTAPSPDHTAPSADHTAPSSDHTAPSAESVKPVTKKLLGQDGPSSTPTNRHRRVQISDQVKPSANDNIAPAAGQSRSGQSRGVACEEPAKVIESTGSIPQTGSMSHTPQSEPHALISKPTGPTLPFEPTLETTDRTPPSEHNVFASEATGHTPQNDTKGLNLQSEPITPIPKATGPTPQSEATVLASKATGPTPQSEATVLVPKATGPTLQSEPIEPTQLIVNSGSTVHLAADISAGETSILASETSPPMTSTPKHSADSRVQPLDGGEHLAPPPADSGDLPAPPSLPSVHPKKTLRPIINLAINLPSNSQVPSPSKLPPLQPPQPTASQAHLQIIPAPHSEPIRTTAQYEAPAQPGIAMLRAVPVDSDSDHVSSTTDSESEQALAEVKDRVGKTMRRRKTPRKQLSLGVPLHSGQYNMQTHGPSSFPGPSPLSSPARMVMVEPQHPGPSSSSSMSPPQNELPTYEQLEASFNSVHSGAGLMFQTAMGVVQPHHHADQPPPPPLDYGMADYLSTQEIHVKAMEGTKSSVMMSLVTQCGVDYVDHGGRSPLMYAVLGNQPKMCELLLGMGASVNLTDCTGSSSIIWATYQSKLEVMKVLLSYGADITAHDPDGLTLFHWAVKSPNVQCLKLLCKYATSGIANKPTSDGVTPLHYAVMCNQPEHIKVLLSSTDANTLLQDNEGRTPLTYAVQIGSPQCIKAILNHNDEIINVSDEKGHTALHYACAEGSLDCVKLLLSYKKCNPHCQDKRGTLPLHWAAASNHPNVVQLLLRRGADRTHKDHDGMTALDHALQRGNQKCVEVLQTQPLNRSSSATSLAGPPTTATPQVLDENGHVQMNRPRRTSLFGAPDGRTGRLPADGQAQIESEQSPSPHPQSSQQTDPVYSDESAQLIEQASVEHPSRRGTRGAGGWLLRLCSCWTGRHNTVVPLSDPPVAPPTGSDQPAAVAASPS